GADFSGADLEGADFSNADVRNVCFHQADLAEAYGIIRVPCSDPRGFSAYAVQFDAGWRIHAACHDFGSLKEARAHWGPEYDGDRETGDGWLAALDWLEIRLREISAKMGE
ncbi:MAG: pentapeptide repeat-containing protein, partial [bacterium]